MIRSHLSVNDIALLVAQGAVPAGPPRLHMMVALGGRERTVGLRFAWRVRLVDLRPLAPMSCLLSW